MSLSVKKMIILESVDSTNNYAMAMVQNGAASSGEAVFALAQTAGKGRREKQWLSNRGENIILSIIVEMQWLPVKDQFQLSAAVALACTDLISSFIKENVKIKWPNDIYINDRKAGGILIENVLKGNLWQWAVIGVGINVNQQNFKTRDFTATSFYQATQEKYDVIELSAQLHQKVLNRIEQVKSGGFTEILNDYNELLFCKEKMVKLRRENVVFETKIKGVSEKGKLLTEDAIERNFAFDEVSWVAFG